MTNSVINLPLEPAKRIVGIGIGVVCWKICVFLCGIEGLQPPGLGLGKKINMALAKTSPMRLQINIVLNEVFCVKETLHQLYI